jgi:hypothetical protein
MTTDISIYATVFCFLVAPAIAAYLIATARPSTRAPFSWRPIVELILGCSLIFASLYALGFWILPLLTDVLRGN